MSFRPRRPSGKKHPILSVILLALLCIGGMELAASYFFAPDVFETVTSPVRWTWNAAVDLGGQAVEWGGQAVHAAADAVSAAASRLHAAWEEFTAPPVEDEEVESQAASDPVLLGNGPVTDPAITELRNEDGKDVLTGGIIPIIYYNQGDDAWKDQPYGSDRIGGYGCGPTAMCMVVSSMTEEDSDPAEMAQWAAEQGYWARKSGSYHSIVEGTAQSYGLTASSISERTPEAIKESLLAGNLLVALMGPGHFTKAGHFIVLRGITLSGSILVADPNSLERSLSEWDPQLILDELSAKTSNGGPLWVIGYAENG